jgi:hypothetical protein
MDKPVCFVGRCGRIDRAEEELRRALIVSVVGREDSGCAVEVRDAIASRFCLEAGSLHIRRAAPNSFLVFFPSVAVADRVVGEGQSLCPSAQVAYSEVVSSGFRYWRWTAACARWR